MRCYTQHDIERYEKLSDNKFKNVHTNEMFAYLDGVDKGIEELEKIKEEMQDYGCSFIIAKRSDLAIAVSNCIRMVDKHIKEIEEK